MAMLHLLACCRDKLAIQITATYVNHLLRPADAEKETSLVKEAAVLLGLSFASHTVDTPSHARRKKLSIEESARELRYQALRKTAESASAPCIAVAHTADDQAEEILLRLLRGTGRKGLSGMRAKNEDIIRPLLDMKKADLLAYLTDRQILFAIDHSNLDRRYLRNRVRLDLLPLLEQQYNPKIRPNLTRTAVILRDEDDLINDLATKAYTHCITDKSTGDLPELFLATPLFRQEPAAIQRRILENLFWQLTVPPTFQTIEHLRQTAINPLTSPKVIHLAHGLRVSTMHDGFTFAFPAGKYRLRGNLDETPSSPLEFSFAVDTPGNLYIPEIDRTLRFDLIPAPWPPPRHADQDIQLLDADRLTFPLIARTLHRGDRFHPLGAPGSKKLGDFFTDRKIPLANRRKTVVIESHGIIAAIIGLCISNDFRLTKASRKAVRIASFKGKMRLEV